MTIGLLERELREICLKRDSKDDGDGAVEENRQEVIDNNASSRTLIIRMSSSTASTRSATRPGIRDSSMTTSPHQTCQRRENVQIGLC